MIEYNKRLVEVDEIINHLPPEDLLKIPEQVRKNIKDKKDKTYKWNYDETKKLSQQNLNRDTVAILSYLNTQYLLNDEQKELIKKIHEYNQEKKKQSINIKNTKDMFKMDINENNRELQENSLELTKKEDKLNIIKKIILKIKKLNN
ncbi:MAG: hypothetical protein E7311_07380 [Clostridiales bacterium]|nr:hypothetical protein [Clostridiales bacterium]